MKSQMLWLGLFMGSGGAASFLYNLLLVEQTRWLWAGAAGIVLLAGLVLVAMGAEKIPLKEAYFAIHPERISYRLAFYSPEHTIGWQQISSVQLCDTCVLFNLYSGRQAAIHFSSFRSHNMACQVGSSIQLAALERNVSVNGVRFQVPGRAG